MMDSKDFLDHIDSKLPQQAIAKASRVLDGVSTEYIAGIESQYSGKNSKDFLHGLAKGLYLVFASLDQNIKPPDKITFAMFYYLSYKILQGIDYDNIHLEEKESSNPEYFDSKPTYSEIKNQFENLNYLLEVFKTFSNEDKIKKCFKDATMKGFLGERYSGEQSDDFLRGMLKGTNWSNIFIAHGAENGDLEKSEDEIASMLAFICYKIIS